MNLQILFQQERIIKLMIDTSKKVDLNFRPDDYFLDLLFEEQAGTKIFGEVRRLAALRKVKSNYYPPELVGRKFHSYLKNNEGRKHPWLMGGEDLPDLYDNEIEIGRVVLRSSTLDVISLRVQKVDSIFHFRIVDEHEINDYQLPHKMSNRPLNMLEVIENLDMCLSSQTINEEQGIIRPWFLEQLKNGNSFDEASKFITVHSVFYPNLENYYEEMKVDWYQQIKNTNSI